MTRAGGRCQRHGCGERLRQSIDDLGRVIDVCDACARNKRGLCRDCPKRLRSPRAIRCPSCSSRHTKQRARERHAARWADPVWRAKRQAQQLERARRPEVRARINRLQKAWLGRMDPDYMTVAMRKYRSTAKGRASTRRNNRLYSRRHAAAVSAHKKAYYQAHRAEIRAYQRAYHQRRKAQRVAAAQECAA